VTGCLQDGLEEGSDKLVWHVYGRAIGETHKYASL